MKLESLSARAGSVRDVDNGTLDLNGPGRRRAGRFDQSGSDSGRRLLNNGYRD